jgi:hypothetical protein
MAFPTPARAFNVPDTNATFDTRIQNLDFRREDVLVSLQPLASWCPGTGVCIDN